MTPFQVAEKVINRNIRWVLLFSFATNALLLAVPIYMLQIYDRVMHSGSIETLLVVSFVIVGCIALFGVLSGILDLLLSSIGSYLAAQLTPYVFSLDGGPGESRNAVRTSDHLEEIRRFFNSGAPATLLSGLWIPLFLFVLFMFHPVMGLIGLAGTAGLLAIAIYGDRRLTRLHKRSVKGKRGSQSFMKSILSQRDNVVALGMEDNLNKAWQQRYQSGVEAADDNYAVSSTVRAVMRTVRLMLQIVMLGTGAALALQGDISTGMIVASSIMMARALAPVESAFSTWRTALRARAAYRALRRDLARPAAVRANFAGHKEQLVVKELEIAPPRDGRHHGASSPLFPPASFSVAAGENLAVVGPVGSGKTLLLRSLLGLHPLAGGRVEIGGQSVDFGALHHYRNLLGYMESTPRFFPGTIAENICRFSYCDVDELLAASQAARLHRHILKLSDGYDTMIAADGKPLSSGQARQVAMARALYGAPRFLLLDDPTAGLDVLEEAAFIQTMQHLKDRGCAMVIVTHSARLLANCDKMLVLRQDEHEYLPDRNAVKARLQNLKLATNATPQGPAGQLGPNQFGQGRAP